jgi:predicted ATPase
VHDRLEGQPLQLAATRRDGPARHRSLQACYDWSYQLLGAHEQAVFQRLGRYSGRFSLASACATAPQIGLTAAQLTVALMALVDQSLILAEPLASGTGYRLLGTARAYAAQQRAATATATAAQCGAQCGGGVADAVGMPGAGCQLPA